MMKILIIRLLSERQDYSHLLQKEKYYIKCFAIDKIIKVKEFLVSILTNVTNKMFDQGYLHSMVFKNKQSDMISLE